MTEYSSNGSFAAAQKAAERRDLLSYVWGLILALVLTAVPFALVRWQLLPRASVLVAIGVLALVQAVVHFRFFLHIGLRRKREDLLLILFSALMLIVMVAGTIWIMANLGQRMMIPGHA